MTGNRITIEPIDISGERGQWYRVHHAGTVLIERTWNPEYDAARALVAQGITGTVDVYRGDRHVSSFVAEKAAKLTIRESELTGPKVITWKAFSRDTQTSPAAANDQPATGVAIGQIGETALPAVPMLGREGCR